MSYPRFSIIIPVYNRPDELDELLHSLTHQTSHDFEVIVVEDGSSLPCGKTFEKYQKSLPISYHFKDNTGPGPTRNFGAKFAIGTYLIFFDSDCMIPPGYFETLDKALINNSIDFFGGPDRAHSSFTTLQKAISYTMTSFLTTGGIRGRAKKLDRFYPRSFNMGIKRDVFMNIGGFASIRFGEDLDLSIRLLKSGYSTELIHDAWVYHKRRADFKKFYRQVFNSGIARFNLKLKYPEDKNPFITWDGSVNKNTAYYKGEWSFGKLPLQIVLTEEKRGLWKTRLIGPDWFKCDSLMVNSLPAEQYTENKARKLQFLVGGGYNKSLSPTELMLLVLVAG